MDVEGPEWEYERAQPGPNESSIRIEGRKGRGPGTVMMERLLAVCIGISTFLLLVIAIKSGGGASSACGTCAGESGAAAAASDATAGMRRLDGILPLYASGEGNAVYMAVPNSFIRDGTRFMYVRTLSQGVGSYDFFGLDRGAPDRSTNYSVRFERIGTKLMMVAVNLRHQAIGASSSTVQASESESFADSTIFAFDVLPSASVGDATLVDVSHLYSKDTFSGPGGLQQFTGYTLDPSLSAMYVAGCKAFERNTDVSVSQTFVNNGNVPRENQYFVGTSAATPKSFTLVVRHSLIKIEGGFQARDFHIRSGFYYREGEDHSVAVGGVIGSRFITRHRVEKGKPLVYYVDNGAPEPFRSALLDGARYWSEAFRLAGQEFVVEVLPDDVDINDVNINVIEWVHRETRGLSYGSSLSDPATGEIVYGHVTLGSRRVRQDYLMGEGLMTPYRNTSFTPEMWDSNEDDDPMLRLALHRLRQLAAHEVGHTLGLKHSFASSTGTGDRASVMDYPHPRIHLATVDGEEVPVILDDVYDNKGIGEWDKLAIRYGYTEFETLEAEREGLEAILREAEDRGFLYLSDDDARPGGASNPNSCIWVDGRSTIEAMEHELAVRRAALRKMAKDPLGALRPGRPHALLQEIFVPQYLYHRYQAICTAKQIGGLNYRFAVSPEPPTVDPVDAADQRAALRALLAALEPSELRVPLSIAQFITPRPFGYEASLQNDLRELFVGYTGRSFDPIAPVEVAAGLVLDAILHPHRVARLAMAGAGVLGGDDDDPLTLGEVLTSIHERVFSVGADGEDAALRMIRRVVQRSFFDNVLELAATQSSAEVAAVVHAFLGDMADGGLAGDDPGALDAEDASLRQILAKNAAKALRDSFIVTSPGADLVEVPPGAPIGGGGEGPTPTASRLRQRRAALERVF